MTSDGRAFQAVRLLAAASLSGLACLTVPSAPLRAQDAQTAKAEREPAAEVRALWVLRTSLTTPERVTALVQSAREHGFNTLLVQVRGRGDAYYRGALEPLAPDLLRQPKHFDPFAAVLSAGRAAGLRVHAWVNVNLVSSATYLPTARDHIVSRRPDWLMVPREIAQDLARIDPDSPAYVGKLARWTRSRGDDVEGLYSTPILLEAVAHTEAVVRDIAHRYALDGVHFDYARYPSDRFDYSRGAIAAFKAQVRPQLAASVRRELDARETDDLFAYPDALEAEWHAFRVARMTALVERLRAAVKAARPAAVVTAATVPDPREAVERRFQDWQRWLQTGAIDAVCPMAYAPEPGRFAEQISAARDAAGSGRVWAGIGAFRLSATQTIENIQTARRLGAAGIVLFSYDSLTDPRQSSPGYLAAVARGAFGDRTANNGSR